MTRIGALGYGGVFVATALLSLVLTPVALALARSRQWLDRPGGHKAQDSPVPYLGGAAIVVAFSAGVMGAALVHPPVSGLHELGAILGIGIALSLMGLVDDLRGLSPFLRLGVESAGAFGAWEAGVRAQPTGHLGIDLAVTILSIVLVCNAFNLLDNMDGLSAGVAAISAFFFFLLASYTGQFLVAVLAIALCGCSLGFLRHNFHPARIYMGDAGSLFLGFLLAVVGIKLRFSGPPKISAFVPVFVLGVALFDTTLVTVTRLIHRRSPLSGGRDHTSHRLVFVGIPVPVAVSLIYGGAVAMGWLGVILARVDRGTGVLLLGFVLAVASFLGVLLALVPVYDTSHRRRLMIAEVPRDDTDAGESADLEGATRP